MDDIVSVEASGVATNVSNAQARRVTVKQQLARLKARCRNNRLVDSKNREIKFYRLQGCWGNAPADYQEILDKQRRELVEMKKKFTVIEISCNPSGDDIPIPSAAPAP